MTESNLAAKKGSSETQRMKMSNREERKQAETLEKEAPGRRRKRLREDEGKKKRKGDTDRGSQAAAH